MSTERIDALTKVIRDVTDAWEEPLDEVHDVPQIVNAVLAHLAERPLNLPALVSAEREADRLALAAARAEVERLTRIIDGYDRTPAEQRAADAEAAVEQVSASADAWWTQYDSEVKAHEATKAEVSRLRAGIKAMSQRWATIPSLTREAHDAMLWASRELDALLRAALDGQVQG